MALAGSLSLNLRWDGRQVCRAEVLSSRPQVSRVLIGKPVAEAVGLVPLLFSLCGKAQGLAARAAAAAASGINLEDELRPGAADSILREAANEHLWRLLLDWPAALGLPPRQLELATARKRLAAVSDKEAWRLELEGILAESLLGMPARQWLNEGLLAWQNTDAPAAVLWRHVNAALAHIEPVKPAAAENSPLARLGGRLPQDLHPVAARLLARLAELVLWAAGELPPKLIQSHGDGAGRGESVALVARGSLHHRLAVEQGRVTEYRISVPTDWNFHPQGPFVKEARGIKGTTALEIETAARLLALSLDPCVGVEVNVGEHHA